MQKLGLPRQLFWIALLLAPTGSSLALISRYRLDATVNTIFKAITFNNQSLIEHFLISLAASGIALLIIMLAFRDKKVLFPKGLIRARWITGVRRKLMPLFSEVFITKWLVVLSSMYVAATFTWEYAEMQTRGTFQGGQVSMDVLGSLVCCSAVWLCVRKKYAHARMHRRLSFI
jgi:hypothetical protein